MMDGDDDELRNADEASRNGVSARRLARPPPEADDAKLSACT